MSATFPTKSIANGVINNEIHPKATKTMDMRFYWLTDREVKKQLNIYWRAGKLNKGNYQTKHHPAIHHQSHLAHTLHTMEGCRNAMEQIERGQWHSEKLCGEGVLDIFQHEEDTSRIPAE